MTQAGEVSGAPARVWMPSLTGIRWWAALAVIVHHTINAFVGTGFVKLDAASTFASGGYLGVTLFFVLSGFVLTWGWKESWSLPGGRMAFYKNRFARIYPLYLFCIPVYYWYVNHVLHSAKAHASVRATVAELGLVHAVIPYREFYGAHALVTWSLSCEAVFYALLPLLLVKLWNASTRTLGWVCAGAGTWLVVLPLLTELATHDDQLRRGIELNPIFCGAHFLLGVTAGIAFRRGWRPRWNPNAVLAAMVATFIAACIVLRMTVFGDWAHLFSAQPIPAGAQARAHLAWLLVTRLQFGRFMAHLLFAPAALAAVIAVASADLRGHKTWVSGRISVLLGEWSYSIYLSHAVVIGYSWSLWRRHGVTAPGIQLVIVFIAVFIVAGLLHYLVEKPASRWLRERFGVASRSPVEVAPVTKV